MRDRHSKAAKAPTPADAPAPEEQPAPEVWFRELSRALGWNPLVAASLGPVLDSYSRTADAWATANRIALGTALAVAECQFRVVCQALEEGLSANADLLRTAANPGQAVPSQAWQAVRGFERLLENLRELTATVSRSQVEIADTLNRRLAELTEEVERHVLRLKH